MKTAPPAVPGPAPRGAGRSVRALGLAVCALALLAGPAGAEGWTLERVLATVRERDPGVRAAHAAGDAGRAQAAQSWAMLSPHLSASAGFTRGDDPAMLFSQKLWQGRFTPADFDVHSLNQPEPQSALQIGLTLDQPLWNGGREWSAPALAAHGSRAAAGLERASVADRLLAAVESYVGTIRAREEVRSAAQTLDAARALRAAAVGRYRQGQAPELDTLRAAAHESESRVRLSAARQSLAVAADALSRRVEATVDVEALAMPEEPAAIPGASAERRGELQAAREGADAAGIESRTAALRLLPSINSRLAVTQYRPWTAGAFERRWMVAVSADLPLFDGAQRLEEWRAARARAAEARAGAERLARDLATGLEAARVEDAVARERRDAARQGRAAAEEALRFATLRYRSGLLPLSDLLATDAEASAARAAEIESSTAITLAHYRLLHAMGDLR